MTFSTRPVFRKNMLPALFCLVALLLQGLGAWAAPAPSVAAVMDEVVPKLATTLGAAELAALDDAAILALLTPEQRRILASEYWSFTVNVPVLVSVVRDTEQKTAPFWLEEAGFTKTGGVVRNDSYTYEVWQKAFPAGPVGLGINGFDRHRPHYFVGVGPQQDGGTVEITGAVPGPQEVFQFAKGATIYHDWPDLVVTEMPAELAGHLLLPTIRGRAREAQLIEAFRQTPHPSSATPDMPVLTWGGDPKTTQTIQWRGAVTEKTSGVVYFREKAVEGGWATAETESVELLADRNILNDPRVMWFTATLRGLKPGTGYEYAIGAADGPGGEFRTAPDGQTPFSFLWMSDTHNRDESVPLLKTAWEKYPDAAFLTISGDLVGTGQQRDDWDRLFVNYADFLRQRPLVPSIGNHDAIDGLGSDLYRSLFRLPDNGPAGFKRGQSYSLRYGNLLLVSLDVTDDIAAQTAWLDRTLGETDALWKVAVFHFPPYALDEEYPDIVAEWGTLFDKHHVDLALSGHVHYYMRTWPTNGGKRVDSPEEGTVYLISVAVSGRPGPKLRPPRAEVADFSGVPTCQAFVVDGNRLTMNALTPDGAVRDTFTLEK